MCYYDGDDYGVQFYSEETRKARKEHSCGECGRTIRASEQYRLSKGLWDGTWDQYKMCAHCVIAAEWLQKECGGYLFTSVHEDLRDHLNERVTSLSLGKLVVGMERKWQRFSGEGLMPLPKMPRVTP